MTLQTEGLSNEQMVAQCSGVRSVQLMHVCLNDKNSYLGRQGKIDARIGNSGDATESTNTESSIA